MPTQPTLAGGKWIPSRLWLLELRIQGLLRALQLSAVHLCKATDGNAHMPWQPTLVDGEWNPSRLWLLELDIQPRLRMEVGMWRRSIRQRMESGASLVCISWSCASRNNRVHCSGIPLQKPTDSNVDVPAQLTLVDGEWSASRLWRLELLFQAMAVRMCRRSIG
ncbi:hypothetical protein EMWEY_00040400 [Eimeria maxima]|uniref:Uncharacterized protein n=1 Tax=Eimeria maxima TaxID=5804 RepID=U6MFX0_EIMMA|nr:hypothetical protein EMWEY_00040400 [Eimeria maxima]CDJ61364.1 hypothetical protein EMWEY_00040400 [Eimeria maxima]